MPDVPSHQLQIGQVLRYPKLHAEGSRPPTVDGLVNFYAATARSGSKALRLEAGINQPAPVDAIDGREPPFWR